MSGLDLAMIGNCTWGGLIDPRGRLVWACLPRFDSDPLFPALLDGDGRDDGVFAIELADQLGRRSSTTTATRRSSSPRCATPRAARSRSATSRRAT